jgi:hypothetical protein
VRRDDGRGRGAKDSTSLGLRKDRCVLAGLRRRIGSPSNGLLVGRPRYARASRQCTTQMLLRERFEQFLGSRVSRKNKPLRYPPTTSALGGAAVVP